MTSTAARLDLPFEDPQLRYHLDVIALDVTALVQAAGGWLYHRVATGWDVNVMVPAQQDLRPLQILGVRTADLETELSATSGETVRQGLAVVTDAFAGDPRIRQRVQAALRRSVTEVVLWGESWPMAVNQRLDAVRHVLTVAGRAFKRQALMAADTRADLRVDTIEMFRSDQKRCLPVDSDLVPVD
ncbi:hypothetical protein [Mycolicibacter senuensis]|uniref:hypothetical protein n=1 Tax=Mycolicibacter senuensis TaxID=386913 RepID=UPI0014027EFC|nr:hypothetical protein [Mycolicibacter senuensis]